MAEQMRPTSPNQAPNPAHSYERTDPHRESGQGRLDNDKTTPTARPDQQNDTVKNKSQPDRQLNAHEGLDSRAKAAAGAQPDHSMHEEEPLDDQAPQDIHNSREKRHPRTAGKGGTPDEGDARGNG